MNATTEIYDKLHVYLKVLRIYTLYDNALHSLMSVVHIYYYNLLLVQIDFENHFTHLLTLLKDKCGPMSIMP